MPVVVKTMKGALYNGTYWRGEKRLKIAKSFRFHGQGGGGVKIGPV